MLVPNKMAIIGEQTSWYDQPTDAKDSFWIGCPFMIGLFNLIKFDASQKDIKWPVAQKIDPFVKLLVIGQKRHFCIFFKRIRLYSKTNKRTVLFVWKRQNYQMMKVTTIINLEDRPVYVQWFSSVRHSLTKISIKIKNIVAVKIGDIHIGIATSAGNLSRSGSAFWLVENANLENNA